MESLGVNSYRFSISWTRILPKGRFGDVNLAGINFYNNVIDALLAKGIQPFVTLHHFDVPQELEDRYGSWLNPESQEDFAYFADICFKSFGDRVKYWVTFNEPNLQVTFGYRTGIFPPSRCSRQFGNCSDGDSDVEPFVAAHNIILSHAAAVHLYRNKYQKEQGGSIGIVLHMGWYEPISNSTADKLAAERAHSFATKWFLDPIIYGKYPTDMENIIGNVLPKFSSNDVERLKVGLDFIGINQYSGFYVQDCISSPCKPGLGSSRTEGYNLITSERNGVPIGESAGLAWQKVYPQGMEKIVLYITERYKNIPLFITENGYSEYNSPNLTTDDFLHDVKRVEFMTGYIDALLRAMRKGADVRGYFVWSLLDNFEWAHGYTIRFGLYHVDYATLKRSRKLSATWYKRFIAEHKVKSSLMPRRHGKHSQY
nr:beta-glucosidase 45-like isoform X2 [Ziziphus jujuba var. spinosa]